MSEKRYIHIHNWEMFQHRDVTRGNRAPAWIRDYTAQLSDPDWVGLTFRQRGILQGLRLLYAANRGRGLGSSPAQLGRMLGQETVRTRDLELLNHAGFIEFSASKLRADCQPRGEERREEQELLTEGLTEASYATGPESQETNHGLHPGGPPHDPQQDADEPQPTPSPGDGDLAGTVRAQLQRAEQASLRLLRSDVPDPTPTPRPPSPDPRRSPSRNGSGGSLAAARASLVHVDPDFGPFPEKETP